MGLSYLFRLLQTCGGEGGETTPLPPRGVRRYGGTAGGGRAPWMSKLAHTLGRLHLYRLAAYLTERYLLRHPEACPSVSTVSSILREAGPWCGYANMVCRRRRVPAQWQVLAGARPRLKLWVCSAGTACQWQLPGGVVSAAWCAAQREAGSDVSRTLRLATHTISRQPGISGPGSGCGDDA
jgi:hypothetical protein